MNKRLIALSAFFFGSLLIAQSYHFYVPHYTQTTDEWETRLVLFNPTPARADINLVAYGQFGLESGRHSLTLEPGEKVDQTLAHLVPDLNDDRGWMRVESSIVEISGVMTFRSLIHGGTASLPLIGTTTSGLAFPHLEHNNSRQSGLVITNPGTDEAQLFIEVISGEQRTTMVQSIGARGKWVGMLAELVPENTPANAAVTVWSEVALTGFALTFQDEVQQIYAVPATPTFGAETAAWQEIVARRFSQAQVKTGLSAGYQMFGTTPVLGSAGVSNTQTQASAPSTMRSDIGSITKMFTATLLLHLQETGSIDLDAPIATYLSDLPRGNEITTRMLLNHTSGLKNYTAEPEFGEVVHAHFFGGPVWTPRQIVDFAFDKGFDFAPGTGWNYSNSGYVLAGLIAEQVSGTPLVDLYRELIFNPLAMNDTFFGGFEPVPNRANVYAYDEDDRTYLDVSQISLAFAGAAGGIVSSNQDLLTFVHTLFSGNLLNAESMDQMLTVAPQSPSEVPYALGVIVDDINGEPIITHNGGTYGGVSSFVYLPNRMAAFAMLINCSEFDPMLNNIFIDWLQRMGVPFKHGITTTLPRRFHKRLAATPVGVPF
ncbi:serine hydrolase domain-containing protein [Acanthopleuribacter pedis]|uniref:Beta-lactamase family protein n=1 Tax=Acanthopleuribacter pedis TaxID=442870 RepID=A0A8J7U5C7_9BACT|nr:serine hydrolase domain-containing protein [Acanthopleuribacter pedis]MBO1322413.1 beta-lactamase family protein [Acanthopleuribacter pedis]